MGPVTLRMAAAGDALIALAKIIDAPADHSRLPNHLITRDRLADSASMKRSRPRDRCSWRSSSPDTHLEAGSERLESLVRTLRVFSLECV